MQIHLPVALTGLKEPTPVYLSGPGSGISYEEVCSEVIYLNKHTSSASSREKP